MSYETNDTSILQVSQCLIDTRFDVSTVVGELNDRRDRKCRCDKDIASIPSNPVGYQKNSKQTPVASKETVYTHFFSLAPPERLASSPLPPLLLQSTRKTARIK
jgi:hypothetical protein